MKPNILFFVIDSFRSDRCYGNAKSSITPNLDVMIKNGVLFTDSISAVASTPVSLGSIFTGLFPFKTGMSGEKYEKLSSNMPNFVNFLKIQGYSAHATASDVSDLLGITADFDLKLNLGEYNNYLGLFNGLGDKLVQKLSSKMNEPWFFYVHIYDLHQPITVPKDFDDEKYGITQYDRMVSAIDSWIGKLLNVLDPNKTLFVLTADHGDYIRSIIRDGKEINLESSTIEKSMWKIGNRLPPSFDSQKQRISKILHSFRAKTRKLKTKGLELSPYEKRILETTRMDPGNHVYDDVLVVPLVLYGSHINQKTITHQQIRSVDIFPTLMDLIGLKHKYKTDGVSLKPLIEGEIMKELYAYVESMPTIKENNEKMIGLRTSKFKYVVSKHDPTKNQLFDLEKDPHEETNIASQNSEIVAKLKKILDDMIKEKPVAEELLEDENRKKVEEELKKLGYL